MKRETKKKKNGNNNRSHGLDQNERTNTNENCPTSIHQKKNTNGSLCCTNILAPTNNKIGRLSVENWQQRCYGSSSLTKSVQHTRTCTPLLIVAKIENRSRQLNLLPLKIQMYPYYWCICARVCVCVCNCACVLFFSQQYRKFSSADWRYSCSNKTVRRYVSSTITHLSTYTHTECVDGKQLHPNWDWSSGSASTVWDHICSLISLNVSRYR